MAGVLKYTIKRIRKRWEDDNLSTREINTIFSDALVIVSKHWVDKMLPLHFGNAAMNRYGYKFRSRRHLARKAVIRPDLVPPAPLEYTGELKSYVMGNARSGQIINSTRTVPKRGSQKTAGVIRAIIPVQIPHPLNPKNKGELTRIIRSERRELDRMFFAAVNQLLDQSPKVIQHETIKAA